MILRPVPLERVARLLYDYARNRSAEATLEELLAYLWHRGLRISAASLKRKLERLRELGAVAVYHQQHWLLLSSDGRQWYLPVRRRIYMLKARRLAEVAGDGER